MDDQTRIEYEQSEHYNWRGAVLAKHDPKPTKSISQYVEDAYLGKAAVERGEYIEDALPTPAITVQEA